MPSNSRIEISDEDAEALAAVAQSEVGHFARYGVQQLTGGLCAVVDTVINRCAHPHYPDSIADVIEQPFQFSALNALPGWTALPRPSAANRKLVLEHLARRAAGRPSAIAGATHFLNPHLSSASALRQWGNFVVQNAIAVYGDDAKRDVHYHGFPPNARLPDAYLIRYHGQEAAFLPSGEAKDGTPSGRRLATRIVEIAEAELAFFGKGARKEDEDPQFRRVGDYWGALGLGFNGRTRTDGTNPAWSAAFISWVLQEAGAGADFPCAQAHCHYFQSFVKDQFGRLCTAGPASIICPKVGDIVHFGREWATGFDYIDAQMRYAADSFYPSHSDIVVEVNEAKGWVRTIGGNVSNSVKEKTFAIDEGGLLVDRKEGGSTVPWIGVLQLC